MGLISYGTMGNPYTTDLAPVNGAAGTLAGIAERDSYLKDLMTGWTHRNTGTKDAPAWTRIALPDDQTARIKFRDEFLGSEDWITLDVPLYGASSVNGNQIPTTGTARGYVTVPRSGVFVQAEVVVEDALATNASNFVTFTVVNRLGSGSGSSALLTAGSALNTTDSGVPGTALAAKKPNALDCVTSPVNSGDVLEVLCTVTGTLGGAIDGAVVKLRILTLSRLWTPRVSRIAGSPTVVSNGGLAGPTNYLDGNAYLSLSATNEAQYAGMDWGYRLLFAPTAKLIWEARVFIGTNPATNSRICTGISTPVQVSSILADANYGEQQLSRYTYDPTVLSNFAWFKLNASMGLLYEAKAGGTSSLANATGLTLSTSTWYTLTIDFRDLTAIRFLVDGSLRGTIPVSMAEMTGSVVPNLFVQKDSGTNAPTLRVDYVDVSWNRS